MRKGEAKPHRKKSLPVPGDVFIDCYGYMRIISLCGYYVIGATVNDFWRWDDPGAHSPECYIKNYHSDGHYYLGNALTDEWENG